MPACLPLTVKEFLLVKDCFALQHEVDRSSQLMRQDGQGAGLVVFVGRAFEPVLSFRVVTEEQYGRFAEGPLQVGVTDLFTGGAIGLTGRFPVALDQPAVGSEVLYTGKAFNGMDLVEDDQ